MLSAHASDETHLVVWYLGEAIIGKGGFILVAPQLGFSMADHSNLFYFFSCISFHSSGTLSWCKCEPEVTDSALTNKKLKVFTASGLIFLPVGRFYLKKHTGDRLENPREL